MKRAFYFYQRAMWYLGIAVGEVRKPLILWNEAALVAIMLSTVFGIKLGIVKIAILYVFVSICGIIVGKILVKYGVVAFNQRLGNQQNPELMEILKRLEK